MEVAHENIQNMIIPNIKTKKNYYTRPYLVLGNPILKSNCINRTHTLRKLWLIYQILQKLPSTSIRRGFKSQNGKFVCLWKISSYDFGKIWSKQKNGQNQG